MQNLGGNFIVFLLGGQNRNFMKVKGLKLLLSLIINVLCLSIKSFHCDNAYELQTLVR